MKPKHAWILSLFLLLCPVLFTGCIHPADSGRADAVAVLHPTEGSSVEGTVTFTRVPGGVQVSARATGLGPGKHGFHIHEKGDCRAADAASAGEHFNPDNTPHGGPESAPGERHSGDLGNLEADASGFARYLWIDPVIRLEGEHAIIGRSVIVHAEEDDLKSHPAGNAGKRLACGVIGTNR
jgi:Cu-Zn family superoxide dismutase